MKSPTARWMLLLGLLAMMSGLAPGVAGAQEWPMRRADQANTGRAPTASSMAQPSPKLEISLGGQVQADPRFGARSLVADVDNNGSDELVYIVGGRLVARAPDNTLIWDTKPKRLLNIVGATDLNGDGRLDIVARRFELGGLLVVDGLTGNIVYERTGDVRIFGVEIATVTPAGAPGPRNLLVVSGQDASQIGFVSVFDFTDATIDPATGRFVSSSVYRAYNVGWSGLNALSTPPGTLGNLAFPLYAVVANFDGDAGGTLEMVIDRITELYLFSFGWDTTNARVTVDFELADVVPAALANGLAVRDFFTGDVDADGDLELFWAGGGPFKHRADRVDIEQIAGTWQISRPWTYDFSGVAQNPGREVLSSVDSLLDIDGDGAPELLVSGFNHTNDGLWHMLVLDSNSATTATVEHDLSDKALLGTANCDADPTPELILASGADVNVLTGLSTIEIHDVTPAGTTLKTTFVGAGGAWFGANGDSLQPSSLGHYAALDLTGDGIDELFIQVDVDGDGLVDQIRAVDCSGATVATFAGEGGTLAPAQGFGGGTVLLDLQRGEIAVADGSLATLSTLTSGGIEVDRSRLVVDDLALGDGVPSNLVAQRGNREVVVYNVPSGFPGTAPTVRWTYQASSLVYPIIADVMGDADKEVVIYDDLGAGKVLRVLDDATGAELASIAIASAAPGNGWIKPAALGNGKVDIVAWYRDPARATNQNLVVAWDPENPLAFVWTADGSSVAGDGTFTHAPTVREFAVQNLDGDADDDVIYHRREDTGVPGAVLRIHLIDGTTGATLPGGDLQIESGTDTSSDLQLFDVDNDGVLELLHGGYVNRYEVNDLAGNLEYQLTFDGFIASQNLTVGIAVPPGGGVANVGVPSRYGHLRIVPGDASIPTFGPCTTNGDCGAGQGCNTELGACVEGCSSTVACSGGMVCNAASGMLISGLGGSRAFVCVEPPAHDFVYSDGARFASSVTLPLAPGEIGHVISGDVDGNDGGLEEFVFGSSDGFLYVVNSDDASLEWAFNADGSIFDTIMADVNADGVAEVVFVTSQGVLTILGTEGLVGPSEVRDIEVSGGVVNQPALDIDEAETIGELACAWEMVANATLYRVTVRTDAGTVVATVDVTATGAATETVVIQDSNFALNRTYFCQVQAVDGATGATGPLVTSDGITIVDDSIPIVVTLTATPPCFNPTLGGTSIDYHVRDLTSLSAWSLEITDALAAVVASDGATNINQPDVQGTFAWDGLDGIGAALPDGDYTVTLRGTDFSAQTGSQSITVCIDTVAPAAPVIDRPLDGQRLGDVMPLFEGSAPGAEGGTVIVRDASDDSILCTATVDATGAWTCTSAVALGDGPVTVTATAVDLAGNASPASTRSFEVDTTLPSTPVITSPVDGAVLPAGAATVEGTAEDGSTVDVFLRDAGGDTLACTATVSGGTFTCDTAALTDGSYTIFAVATDDLGQTSAESAEVTFFVDEDGDTDNDGIPDFWEDRFGLDPSDPSDAGGDLDSDTLTNLAEFQAGSDPTDSDSDDDGLCDNEETDWNLDADNDGAINAMDADSDDDGLLDATERSHSPACAGTDLGRGLYVVDADVASQTSMVLPDSDSDGIRDGAEDPSHDGRVDDGETDPNDDTTDPAAPILVDTDGDGITDAEELLLRSASDDGDSDDDGVLDGDEANFAVDLDGDGLASIVDPDSDNDGLADGTELGIDTAPAATDVARGRFVVDGDTATITSMVLADTDGDGIRDGAEDPNYNGTAESGELDPIDPFSDPQSLSLTDTDSDGLTDAEETFLASLAGTDAASLLGDGDFDDDGVLDGDEPNWWDDNDADGAINLADFDSDEDCVFDGTELGLTQPTADTDLGAMHFVPDEDNDSTTLMLVADTDGDTFDEDLEDLNCNGQIDLDLSETDPNDPLDFPPTSCTMDDECPMGTVCIDGSCEVPPMEMDELDGDDIADGDDTDVTEGDDTTPSDVLEDDELLSDTAVASTDLKGGGCSCRIAAAGSGPARDLPLAPLGLGLLGLGAALVIRRRR